MGTRAPFRELFTDSPRTAWLARVLPQFADQPIGSLFKNWGMSFTARGQHVLKDGGMLYVGLFEIGESKAEDRVQVAGGGSVCQMHEP